MFTQIETGDTEGLCFDHWLGYVASTAEALGMVWPDSPEPVPQPTEAEGGNVEQATEVSVTATEPVETEPEPVSVPASTKPDKPSRRGSKSSQLAS